MMRTAAIIGIVVILAGAAADASIILTINRISDTQVTITSDGGTFDPPNIVSGYRAARNHIVNPFTVIPTALTWNPGTIVINPGAYAANACFPATRTIPGGGGTSDGLQTNYDINPAPGNTLDGSYTVTLTDGTWAPVGSSDDFYYGYDGTATLKNLTGTWNMVPEPATLALLAIGGLAVLARRRR